MKALLIGNSDGIGLAVTRRFLERGMEVRGISRSPSPVEHPAYTHIVADVSGDAFPGLVQDAANSMRPDICVYCAGIGGKLELDNMQSEVLTFEVNLMGMVKTAAAVIPGMVARKGGHFIGLSSMADELNSHQYPAYSGTKAGFTRYMLSLAAALKRRHVAVTNVRFGFVRTKMPQGKFLPFVMTVDRAADHIERCVRRRPASYTAPIAMIPLVKLARLMLFIRNLGH